MGHTWPDEQSLIDYASKLEHMLSREVATLRGGAWAKYNDKPTYSGKTGVGDLVEAFLGKDPDNDQAPDIPELGIEVKTIPLLRGAKKQLLVKESTSLTMMDYFRIDQQEWSEAYVRGKIARILWAPYMHHKDKREVQFFKPFLWSPELGDYPVFEADYGASKVLINEGRAHELSETIARVLSPRRKGSKGQMRKQPHSPIPAKSRAWAFKASYTRPIIAQYVEDKPVPRAKIPETIVTLADVEPVIMGILHKWQGKTLQQISEGQDRVKLRGGDYLSAASHFVRDLIGQPTKGESVELEKLGIRVRTAWARPSDCKPWERTSFPAMVLKHFAEEEWGDSSLEGDIDRILFIPLWEEKRPKAPSGQRVADQGGRVLGRAFLWQPGALDWPVIEQEWHVFKRHVERGDVGSFNDEGTWVSHMPTEKETDIIHMRPHTRNNKHRDEDPHGNTVTTQSFWVNASHVQQLLREYGHPPVDHQP